MPSGFGCPQFPWLLAVDDNTLKAFRKDWDPVTIRAGLTPGAKISYAEINGEIFWSNEYENGRVTRDAQDLPFGLERPAGVPNLAVLADEGGMDAGRYQTAVTFLTADAYGEPFEESGSTLAALINVPANGGIALSEIPQPTDPRVVFVRIYVTDASDDVLHQARDLPVGMTEFNLGSSVRGKALETQFASPTPPGQIVRYYNGRALVARDRFLLHGLPLHYGQTRLSTDFEQEPARITLMEPVGSADAGGVYVAAASRIWFLRGNFALTKDIPRVRVHDFGAVPGTGQSVPAKWFDPTLSGDAAFWMDTEGVSLIGLPTGEVRVVAREYLGPRADYGSVLVREINGIRQVIANMHGTVNKGRAGDYVVASIERNGIRI